MVDQLIFLIKVLGLMTILLFLAKVFVSLWNTKVNKGNLKDQITMINEANKEAINMMEIIKANGWTKKDFEKLDKDYKKIEDNFKRDLEFLGKKLTDMLNNKKTNK